MITKTQGLRKISPQSKKSPKVSLINQIINLKDDGATVREISTKVGLGPAEVRAVLGRFWVPLL